MSDPIAPLGPLYSLPSTAAGLKDWKVLLFCTAVNSFSQRVVAYLGFLGCKHVSVCLATSQGTMEHAAEKLAPNMVVCPFLTTMVPSTIFTKYLTLVVHPGPPGDEGPAALDWTMLGDTGSEPDSTRALMSLLSSHDTLPIEARQRSHWGCIVFQANEHVDAGSVWAWEQYPLPPLGTFTKASLYQNQHSIGAISALITAMIRVYHKVAALDPTASLLSIKPDEEWERLSVTDQKEFMGGQTRNRPQIPPKQRKPDWKVHTADDVCRIIHSSDSQPGAQIGPLVKSVKSNLFVYGAHTHCDVRSIPRTLYTSQGFATWDAIPTGSVVATRDGAVFFKTVPTSAGSDGAIGVWITYGRIIKKVGQPLDPKIPLVEALKASGQEQALKGVQEWSQATFEEVPGTWQEVFVRTEIQDGKLAQLVYWNFYNGAFSTRQCQMLLKALQWATAPERGNLKILALMGGSYFSNGIALNTIEAASDPAFETWHNINAIDDIVEFLGSDTHKERSPFMTGIKSLCERGIVTVACVRANAAAGGTALAAGCDVVVAARGVVLNPAYRAMGLHGSEFHSFSYLTRCGQEKAASMLRDMLPQSTHESFETGLVDIQVGEYTSSKAEIEQSCIDQIKHILSAPTSTDVQCAPWSRPTTSDSSIGLIDSMSSAKRASYAGRPTPLLHYRNEELSQMLLDSFHPVRSKRYHTRRYTFIRKIKGGLTPTRYANELSSNILRDEEELESFDNAPGWTRGQEWAWAGLDTPTSLQTSEWTRIRLYPDQIASTLEKLEGVGPPVPAKVEFAPPPNVVNGSTIISSRSTSPARLAPPVPARKNSTASQMTTSSFGDTAGNVSLSSADSGPMTPPIKSNSRFLTFRRKSSGHSREASMGAALHQVDTNISTHTPGEEGPMSPGGGGNGGGSRFKTLSRKFAAAWKDISQPHPQFPDQPNHSRSGSQSLSRAQSRNANGLGNGGMSLTSKQKKRSSILFGPSSVSLVPSVEDRRKSVSGDGVGAGGRGVGYVRPNVKGEAQCEYPCLYQADEVATDDHAQPRVVHA